MDRDNLALHLLGEAQLLCGQSSLDESLAGKEQALLIYLACQPEQRFSREHLSTLLWSEVPQSRARYNLRRALWNLRRVLDEVGLSPEACLAVEGSWIHLAPAGPCWVDVREFEEVLQAYFQDPKSHFSAASEGIRRIRRALDLYRGDFLAGFSVPNAPTFEEWLTFERERLFLLLLRALAGLIQSFIAQGEQDEAIATCQRLLVLDPLQEDIHRLLMRLYWETGQRAQALRQYGIYQDLLRRELGIEPLEETQDLYRRILQHETPPVSAASSLILTSRVTPPSPAPESLPRPRLFSLLDRGLTARLTLLSAPPGYGKTTLMGQWLVERSLLSETSEVLVAWYKVDQADNNPSTFIDGLTASVAQMHPAVGRGLQDEIHDLASIQGDTLQAMGLLLDALASLRPASFVIVLDDLEHLTVPDSRKLPQHLVENLPVNGHIYLLTRVDPQLPLPRLRVRGQLVEIRATQLRFTDEEVAAFLRQAHGLNLSPAEVAELTTRAEGWVAPLWLAANAFTRFTASLDLVWEGLFAYLRDEVLTPQPPEVRTFLLRSAVLDRLSPSVCQAVVDMPEHVDNPAQWLAELEQRNLFLQRVVPQAPVPLTEGVGGSVEPEYVYHPLFLAFLRAELPYHLSHTEVSVLHRRAARTCEQRSDLETALFHYQQIGDETGITRLLEQIAPAYLREGRLEPLARWLDQLEPAMRDRHPRLTLHTGQLRQAEGRVEEARRLYKRATTDFESEQDEASQGDSFLALAELELLRGQYSEGIELGQQAMACWNTEDTRRRTSGLCVIAQLQACQGNLSAAESTLKQGLRLIAGRSHPALAFRVLRTQAWVAYLQGAYHRAMGINYLAEQEAGRDVSPQIVATLRNPVPAILREWGEVELASTVTQRQMEAAHQIQNRLALSRAYSNLGNLHLDRAQFAEAERAFRQAVTEAEAAGEDGLYLLNGEAHLVLAHLLQGHATEAADVAESALDHCQARGARPLELAIAQTAVSLAYIDPPHAPNSRPGDTSEAKLGSSAPAKRELNSLLDEAHRTFDRLGVRYGVSVSAALIGLTHLGVDPTDSPDDHQRQARHYIGKALTLAAAEGYVQTFVTARQFTMPIMLFALREGIEHRFVSQVLSRMGPEALAGVTEIAQDSDPAVRARAAGALEMMLETGGAQEEASSDRAIASPGGDGIRSKP